MIYDYPVPVNTLALVHAYWVRGQIYLIAITKSVANMFYRKMYDGRDTIKCGIVFLRPSQQLRSCQDGQFTLPHFYLGKLD